MIVKDHDDYFELSLIEQLPASSYGAGDSHFAARVRMSSMDTVFSVESAAWVQASALRNFAQQLRLLEQDRKGSAVMESMSPGELRLEVRIYDGWGHVGAFGQVGHWCYSGVCGPYWLAVTFGLPFCPTELPKLVREFDRLCKFGSGDA